MAIKVTVEKLTTMTILLLLLLLHNYIIVYIWTKLFNDDLPVIGMN